MAGDGEDDLDAFFDEVEEVAAKVEDEPAYDNTAASSEPPRKKAKPTVMGIVVAAASEKIKPVEINDKSSAATESTTVARPSAKDSSYPAPPPPPPPPPRYYAAAPPPSTNASNNNGATLPIGPAPPAPGGAAAGGITTTKKAHVRTAAGKTWVDPTLDEWPENDFRIFVGNLGNDVTDENLWQHFCKYSSLLKAKIIRDAKKPGQPSKGYAFVSFGDALECAKALREMDQTWLGSRPIRIKRSNWKDRELKNVRNNEKKEKKQQKRMKLL